MSSTFFGLTIAGSALSSFQAAINTTANNISNVQTDGYTKQVANRVASEAMRVHLQYGTAGTGVTTTSITQLRSSYYDSKYWYNNSYVGYYDQKVSYNNQIQNYIKDDSTQTGFSTILTNMFNYMNTLSTKASDATVRKQFIESANSLSTYFGTVSSQMETLQKSCNNEIQTDVSTINSVSQKVSVLNKQINQIETAGGYANELRDQRATLVDQLSKIVPVEVSETPVTNSDKTSKTDTGATNYTITLDGQTLVDSSDYRTLDCKSRDQKVNQSDVDGLYDIVWSDTQSTFNPLSKSMSGGLKGLFEMRDGNNGSNFTGNVTSVVNNASGTGSKVTFAQSAGAKLSITSANAMNMPTEGKITIGNKEYSYSGFSYTTDVAKDGTETVNSYTFNVTDGDSATIAAGNDATIGKSIDSMGIPYYMNQMNTFLRSFSSKFNQIEETGVDLNGKTMGAFFVAENTDATENDFSDYSSAVTAANATTPVTTATYNITTDKSTSSDVYYWMTTDTFKVAQASLNDSSKFATESKTSYDNDADGVSSYDLVTSLAKLQSATTIYRSSGASSFLKVLISDNSIETQQATSFQTNFTNIQGAIKTQRTSVSGVDEDEEALDLVKFQNAYNLSSKIISTLTAMYDRLILETGV